MKQNSNFEFIQPVAEKLPGLNKLYKYCYHAELFQKNFPNESANNARKALEWLVKNEIANAGSRIEYYRTLDEMLGSPEMNSFISKDNRFKYNIYNVKKTGNKGSHDNDDKDDVNESQSFNCLRCLFYVVYGFLYRWGLLPYECHFDARLIPNNHLYIANDDTDEPEVAKDFIAYASNNALTNTPIEWPSETKESLDISRKKHVEYLLYEAHWELIDGENRALGGKYGKEILLNDIPKKGHTINCEYVLYGRNSKPLAIVVTEKNRGKLIADFFEQKYQIRPIIYYTDGYSTYITDGLKYPSRQVMGLHTIEDLELIISHRQRGELVYKDTEIADRDYQKQAVRNIRDYFNQMHRRGLIVMATGTGKTRVAIAICEMFLKSNWAKNILFLADRNALVRQAKDNFTTLLPDYSSCILTEAKESEKNARLMFSTYQTMIKHINDEDKQFSIGRFDIIIIDEAHRSIFGKYGTIFDYFDSFLIGMTATPRNDLDRNTYEIFGLDNRPNFEYSIDEAIKDKYLVDFVPISYTTKRLREGIKYDSLKEEEKEQLEQAWDYEQTYDISGKGPRDVNRSELYNYIYNTNTIDLVIHKLMSEGQKIQSGNKIGKSIIFAYNHNHAELIVERFHKLYAQLDRDFCQLIDSSVDNVDERILKFKRRDMYPQIAVSVDMLDTGVDIPDILNLVLFKPVYSRIKYIQMIGRGTRKSKMIFDDGTDKENFYIFDWCENFEYFNQNKDKKMPSQAKTLSEKLFCLKTDIAFKLQLNRYQNDKFMVTVHDELKKWLLKQVVNLSSSRIDVRNVQEIVTKWQQEKNWKKINEQDITELKLKIAPLIVIGDDDKGCLRFDLLMRHIEFSLLERRIDASRYKEKVTQIAIKLKNKTTIPSVQQNMSLLNEVADQSFWNKKGSMFAQLEFVRKKIRELVYILFSSTHEPFIINISDEIVTEENIGHPTIYMSYRNRAESYLEDNRENIIIQKIYNFKKLSLKDIKELKKVFWQEIGSKEEYDQSIEKSGIPYGDNIAAYIRSIIGVNRDVAKKQFLTIYKPNVPNKIQELFVDQIINYVCENGDITPMTLVTDDMFKGLGVVFKENPMCIRLFVEDLHKVINPEEKRHIIG